MLNHFWWGSIFLINVPAMLLLPVLVPLLVPESKDPEPTRSLSAGLLIGYVFVRRQRTHTDAMISRGLFPGRGFGSGVVLNALATFAMMDSAYVAGQLPPRLGESVLEVAREAFGHAKR